MASGGKKLRIAFVHPDLGIGGAERLVVDAAVGLQSLGHSVDIFTSHHDPAHAFEETTDGTLRVHGITPPIPRAIKGKFHIVLAHARQLHLISHVLSQESAYDVFFVDQLSTCIPFLRTLAKKRVVFYCHFPDKLLANASFTEVLASKRGLSLLRRLYRLPMDWLEEATTTQSDVILANSKFTAAVTKANFASLREAPKVVYPGLNIAAYSVSVDRSDVDVMQVSSDRPTFLSLNRFEKKKNTALAVQSFALLRNKFPTAKEMRLVIAGGYDPRLQDNIDCLKSLTECASTNSLTYNIVVPSTSRIDVPLFPCTPANPDILFLLNFTTSQRTALLTATSTLALMYTPTNEHFGIVPIEAMICGLPVLATNTGGPTESVVDKPNKDKTGWLRAPDAQLWAEALGEIVGLTDGERRAMSARAKTRAVEKFGMNAMARGMEVALEEAVAMGPVPLPWSLRFLAILGLLGAFWIGLRI
ncbi:hypothetical protein HWV62_10643 [Athelia sp. TMB]|nr:hypothetical protein HWV62_16438 [Athelia sp. TMB]KAF7975019.1 hypothetical protein HWV62_10643 [Athelia sp. TMB]